jgi:outer membrane immunogenic protein
MRSVVCAMAVFAAIPVGGAFAADMPLKAPPIPYTTYNWTGFYGGAEAGAGWATQQVYDVTGGAAFPAGTLENPLNLNGPLGGFYGGANYQFNQFVIGIDGDYTWANLVGTGRDVSTVDAHIATHSDNVEWLATVTGRVGYAVNNWLLFAKGGGAWSGWSGNSTQYTAAGTTALTNSTASSTRSGWTAGAGIEYGFTAHITAKIEYDYVGFSTTSFPSTETTIATGAVTVFQRSATSSLNMVKVGLALKY